MFCASKLQPHQSTVALLSSSIIPLSDLCFLHPEISRQDHNVVPLGVDVAERYVRLGPTNSKSSTMYVALLFSSSKPVRETIYGFQVSLFNASLRLTAHLFCMSND